jgi:hypothetical protein
MNATRTLPILLAGVVLAGTVAAVAALAGNPPSGSPAPSVPPRSAPIVTPSPAPSDDPGDGTPIRVDLDIDTAHDVYVDIFDRTGRLVDARSGPSSDGGASIEPYKLRVENMDERTLRLTWVDYPIDNALELYVSEEGTGVRLVLVQPEPTGDTDSYVSDRVLILEFADEISADDVEAFLQDGLDV